MADVPVTQPAIAQKNPDGTWSVRIQHHDSGVVSEVHFPNVVFAETMAKSYAGFVNGINKVEEHVIPTVKEDGKKALTAAKDEAAQLISDAKAEAQKLLDAAKPKAEELISLAKAEAAGIIKGAESQAKKLFAEAKTETETLVANARAEAEKISKAAKSGIEAAKKSYDEGDEV